ncbi:LysR substrate binding domain protein [Lactobacillus selangorensis]|uniref:LysR substrate binding domain protein n=1 Tax=Lactobacillus selangorensis TaxID=81857 RepID=A0A0R2G206_9LACO|nr:LysR family transcriptional regulator [Lactobacillus selangorensis]KRN28134.1 LysR substrate binding domain protein [Lactobacillus selangorensis]KRN30989.1 LysR substrate binding domain protein [Lactobacillus selangorensis]
MNIRVLRYFLAIAELRTISGAARFLHVSQPTLSKQISDLEQELGVKLFTRGHREITLTQEGRYLQARAKEIIQLVDKTTDTLQSDHDLISGELDIGAGESIGMERILKTVSGIQRDYPGVKIHLHSGDAAEVEDQLDAGVLDYGVIIGKRQLNRYATLKLPEFDRWGIVLPADDPLAQKETLQPDDLRHKPLIVSEQAAHRHRFADWWRNQASDIRIIGTYNLLFNATILVRNHSCYAVALENLIVNRDNAHLAFRRFSPELTEPITLIWKNANTPSPVARLFLQRLQASLATSEEK